MINLNFRNSTEHTTSYTHVHTTRYQKFITNFHMLLLTYVNTMLIIDLATTCVTQDTRDGE